MPQACPRSGCASPRVQSRGSFWRRCDKRKVRIFQCSSCKKYFSEQTLSPTYRLQYAGKLDMVREKLMCSASQRRCAKTLGIRPRTVARLVSVCARIDRAWQVKFLALLGPVKDMIFDEMMSYEHTRWKPLSLPIAVCERTQALLAMSVARIPPSGLSAAKAFAKYGPRTDESPAARLKLLSHLESACGSDGRVKSDAHKAYGAEIKKAMPQRFHEVHRSRRGCVVGFGELKKVGFDPLFFLNHTCAMVRDSLATLKRRTWTTTKRPECLQNLLDIYVRYHNEFLLHRREGLLARSRDVPVVV